MKKLFMVAVLCIATLLQGCDLAALEREKRWSEAQAQAHALEMKGLELEYKMKIAVMENKQWREYMMWFYDFAGLFLMIVVPALTIFGCFYIQKKREVGEAFRRIEFEQQKLLLDTFHKTTLALPSDQRAPFVNQFSSRFLLE